MIEIAHEYATKTLQGKRGVRPSAPKHTRVVMMKKVTEKDSKKGPSAPSVAKEKKNYPQSNAYKQTNLFILSELELTALNGAHSGSPPKFTCLI